MRQTFFISIGIAALISIMGITSSIYEWQTMSVVVGYAAFVAIALIVLLSTRHLSRTVITAMNKTEREAKRRSELHHGQLEKHRSLVQQSNEQLSAEIKILSVEVEHLKASAITAQAATERVITDSLTANQNSIVDSITKLSAEIGLRLDDVLRIERTMNEKNKINIISNIKTAVEEITFHIKEEREVDVERDQ